MIDEPSIKIQAMAAKSGHPCYDATQTMMQLVSSGVDPSSPVCYVSTTEENGEVQRSPFVFDLFLHKRGGFNLPVRFNVFRTNEDANGEVSEREDDGEV